MSRGRRATSKIKVPCPLCGRPASKLYRVVEFRGDAEGAEVLAPACGECHEERTVAAELSDYAWNFRLWYSLQEVFSRRPQSKPSRDVVLDDLRERMVSEGAD